MDAPPLRFSLLFSLCFVLLAADILDISPPGPPLPALLHGFRLLPPVRERLAYFELDSLLTTAQG